jgi:hypothetical protein
MRARKANYRVYGCVVVTALLFGVASCAAAEAYGKQDRGGQRLQNYLVITASEYAGSAPLTQFVNAKTAQGFNVTTYSVPSGTSNTAIKDYIQSLWGTLNSPKYILLVGDTDGSSSTPTTIPHWTGGGSKAAPTDLPYACMDTGDDWHPEISVGRFSVRSVSALADVVEKSLFVEAGNFPDPNYVKRGAFLANPSTQGMAEPTHDWVIENYFEPNGYEGIRIYSSQGGDTQDVTNAVNLGCLWVVYYGHSGSSGWWDPAFDQDDVRALSNQGLYGVVFCFSCNVGNYTLGECFGETWQREADKGAAAVVFPSSYIYWGSPEAWEPSTVLEHSFYRAFFEDDIWNVGLAWRTALYHFETEFDGSTDIKRNFFELYNVLGDPSLLLPQPFGFNLSPDPVSQNLCCPPEDEAVYTIEVGMMGGFDEQVTLSAGGEPAGATIDFSPNSLVPPFTSVMTLGNLSAVAGGDYNVVITGTSASTERSTNVGLSISNDVPDQVTLLSPEDGATDVALMPTLSWEAVPGGLEYEVELATDADFANVVYSTTVDIPSCTVDTPLDMLATYYWHVRGTNACGQGDFSTAFSFTTVNMVMPVFYDLLNGETGTYTYFDDAYDGDGDNSQPLAPLTNGLGDLTDGVIATQHWNVTWAPYVGWVSIDPTITFHFGEAVNIDVVTLHLDDSGGGGGVYPPDDVTITMGDQTLTFPCSDPAGNEPFAFTLEDLGLSGDTLELTLSDYSTSGYMMLSEVEFYGSGPEPCFGDLDGDGDVDLNDLAQLLANYGMSEGAIYEDGDLDGDGDVDLADLATLLAVYGTNCD